MIINCRNETGQPEIAMQALGWICLAIVIMVLPNKKMLRDKNKAKVMFKIRHGLAPARLSNIGGPRNQ